jgi:hypothetical protein
MSSSGCVVALVAAACSGTPEGTVTIVTGEETEVLSRAPAPVTLLAEKIAADGSRTQLTRAQLPLDTISLGDQPRTEVGGIAVLALDAAGKPLVRGETLFVQWGALENTNLEVFIQRTGELARMPRGPGAIDPTVVTLLVGRYVLAASGTTTMLYDLLGLRPLSAPPVLPRPAKSIATVGTAALVIDEAGATTFDISDTSSFPLEAPPGGTFAEVAGGARVGASDGSQFIVGATRTAGGPTTRILVVDIEGKVSFASLTVPREGACATFVEGRGIIVFGGSATGAGAEVLAPGSTLAAPLPFPPDPVRGCGATALDSAHVGIAGGTGAAGDTGAGLPVRVLDLACTTACTPAPWPDVIPLVRAQALALAPDAAFVVGDDATGASHAFRASATGLREVPLRFQRRGARLIPTPTGTFVVVGGGIGIEQYLE